MYNGTCYPDGSFFFDASLDKGIDLICGDTSGTGGGQVILPNGNDCTASTSPIECIHNDTDDTSIIRIRKVDAFFTFNELQYNCCLPHDCSNDDTHMITANIFGKKLVVCKSCQ